MKELVTSLGFITVGVGTSETDGLWGVELHVVRDESQVEPCGRQLVLHTITLFINTENKQLDILHKIVCPPPHSSPQYTELSSYSMFLYFNKIQGPRF